MSIPNKLPGVIRYLERKDLLTEFSAKVKSNPDEIKMKVDLLDEIKTFETQEFNLNNSHGEKQIKTPQMKSDRNHDAKKDKVDLLLQLYEFLSTKKSVPRSTHTAKIMRQVSEEEGSEGEEEFQRQRKLTSRLQLAITRQNQNEDDYNPTLHKFDVGQKSIYRVKRSLDCFSEDNSFRKFCLRVVESDSFGNVIMIVIVLNSISIAVYDSSQQRKEFNKALDFISYTFTAVYALEAIAKIIANGLLLGKYTYLRNYANIFDFFIVWIAILQVLFRLFLKEQTKIIFVFKVLKVLRVGRLLSSFYKIPQMRHQLRTIGKALEGIMHVILFLALFFIFLSLIGLQLFSQEIYNACRLSKFPVVVDGEIAWPRATRDDLPPGSICVENNKFTIGGFHCPPEYTCGNSFDLKYPMDDHTELSSQLYYNVFIWKHFGGSLLSVFQIVTAESWGNHMYNLINSSNFFLPFLFCFVIHMVGTYYLMNLMLVVIIESYIQSNEDYADYEMDTQQQKIMELQKPLLLHESTYAEDLKILHEYIESEEFKEDMHDIETDSEDETGTYVNKDVMTTVAAGNIEENKVINEPEIEDGLVIEPPSEPDVRLPNAPPVDSDFMTEDSKSSDEFAQNSDMESYSLDLTKHMQKTLKRLYKMYCMLKNEKNREVFLEFMLKATVLAKFDDVNQKMLADNLVELEYSLLIMKFENVFRDAYNDERFLIYGLKREKQVLTIIDEQCKGMFDKFQSKKQTKKQSIILLRELKGSNSQENMTAFPQSHFGDSNNPTTNPKLPSLSVKKLHSTFDLQLLSRSPTGMRKYQSTKAIKDEVTQIQLKPKLELRDGIILTLDRMRLIQKVMDDENETSISESQICARDLLSVTCAIENIEQTKISSVFHLRARSSFLIKTCLAIDRSPRYQVFISFMIIANFIILALDRYPSSPMSEYRMEMSNTIFYFVFLFEMVIKLKGYGATLYFKNSFNQFDFLIVVISTIEIVLNSINFAKVSLSAVRALRIVRLLRLFKLAKTWKDFNELLNLLFLTLQKVAYLTCILLLFWVTFAILGKELFHHRLAFDATKRPIKNAFDFLTGKYRGRSIPPDFNFDGILESCTSVFLFFTSDGWSTILADALRMPGISNILVIFFFFALYIGGNMIIVNLFRAILIREFDQQSLLDQVEKQMENEIKRQDGFLDKLRKSMRNLNPRSNARVEVIQSEQSKSNDSECPQQTEQVQTEEEQDGAQPAQQYINTMFRTQENNNQTLKDKFRCIHDDRTLFVFSRENRIRVFMKFIEKFNYRSINFLNATIYLAIGVSSILPCFQSPIFDQTTSAQRAIDKVDFAMTIIFTIEIVIKIVSKGFIFNGPKSYLRSPANILDFFVVLISLVSSFIQGGNLGTVKVLRIATRLTRPMRLVFRDEKLKISIKVIQAVLPKIINLLFIYFLFCMIFATISVSLLSGRSFNCKLDQSIGLDLHLHETTTEQDCLNSGGEWILSTRNFDNVVYAFIQMFTMAQAVGWSNNLLDVIRSTGTSQAPHAHAPFGKGLFMGFFIILWMIVGYFFFQNLFVALVIAGYNREAEQNSTVVLTVEQRRQIETELMSFRIQPLLVYRKPKNKIRKFAFNLLRGKFCEEHKKNDFSKKVTAEEKRRNKIRAGMTEKSEYLIRYVVLLNALVLFLKWPKMHPTIQRLVDVVSYICNSIFILEAVLKLTAYGRDYFRSNWNRFEFFIVVGSLIFISPQFAKERLVLTLIRCIMLMKIVTNSKGLRKLKMIYSAISQTVFSLMNVSLLMMLCIYIFAIIGNQIFAAVKLNGPMTNLYNFQTIAKSCLTLYRMMTRDHWNELMEAISLQNSVTNPCISNPTYQDYVNNGYKTVGCGKPVLAAAYFFTYSFIVSIIFLSLFVAIICAAYFAVSDKKRDMEFAQMIQRFRVTWSYFDPKATGKINDKDFETLIFALNDPLGLHERHRFDKKLLRFYKIRLGAGMRKHQQAEGYFWYFDEVLDNLLFFNIIYERVKIEIQEQRIKQADNSKLKRTSLPENYNDGCPTVNIRSIDKDYEFHNRTHLFVRIGTDKNMMRLKRLTPKAQHDDNPFWSDEELVVRKQTKKQLSASSQKPHSNRLTNSEGAVSPTSPKSQAKLRKSQRSPQKDENRLALDKLILSVRTETKSNDLCVPNQQFDQ